MVPPVDIVYMAQDIARLGDEIERAADDGGDVLATRPEVLRTGLLDLIGILGAAEADGPEASGRLLRERTGTDPGTLLSHGLDLLAKLAQTASRLNQIQAARAVERLALPLACWLIRRGAELSYPEPVVNAAAGLANALREPDDLAELYSLMSEVVDAVSPLCIQQSEGTGPTRPWRVLLLNRAIVATRSHRPALMVEAFQAVCEQLPEEAPGFFREGMGQMEALDYPQPVRDVMERYYDVWCAGQRLH